jgi:hypothetical protein
MALIAAGLAVHLKYARASAAAAAVAVPAPAK